VSADTCRFADRALWALRLSASKGIGRYPSSITGKAQKSSASGLLLLCPAHLLGNQALDELGRFLIVVLDSSVQQPSADLDSVGHCCATGLH
jgi:hypothetical protein